MGLQAPLWRAIAAYRVAALAHAALLIAWNARGYAHPAGGWLVLGLMLAWTVVTVWAYATPPRRGRVLLAADLAVAAVLLVASGWVIGTPSNGADPDGTATTLPALWVAAPVLAWAVAGGRRAGVLAAVLVAAADLVARGGWTRGGWVGGVPEGTVNAAVLLLLAGFTVGHFARLAREAERRLQQAAQRDAANRERERLARGIHDSVLQVLALVQRRGNELGGEAAELGRLAGEQEQTLRTLMTGAPAGDPRSAGEAAPRPGGADVDLRAGLERLAGDRVTVSVPADPVWLPAPAAGELLAAVGAALDNVRAHAGTQASAWLLLEVLPAEVALTVRDDGPGIPEGRLAQAAAEGRIGIVQSIEGRLRDLGGSATVTSQPGAGTEVELRLPWLV